MSCQGRRRRWAARGRKESEWRITTAAESILESARWMRETWLIIAMPERQSCSKAVSSMQFRVTICGSVDDDESWIVIVFVLLITAGDLDVIVSLSLLTVIISLSLSLYLSLDLKKREHF